MRVHGPDRPRARRDESGAIAVMVAVMAVVILGMAAVAIDMGQVYAKRASLQSAVDQAVLAAAAELDGTTACTDAAKDAARRYLLRNWIDQGGDPETFDSISLDGSTDADGSYNGSIACNKWRVDLWAPTAKVELGLAKAVTSQDKIDVPAHAAAEVRSPRLGGIPFYATSTCSTGFQVLAKDSTASSPVTSLPPFPNPPLNDSDVTSLSSFSTPVGTPVSNLVIYGTRFTTSPAVTAVGFTNASGDHYVVPATPTSATAVTVANVPTDVTDVADLWYIRVRRGTTDWSSYDGTSSSGVQTFTVGDDKLYCDESQKGNFGSLEIDRATPANLNKNDLVSYNTALGADHDLSTAPGAPNASPFCVAGGGFITDAVDGQNCLSMDTGLPANGLEEGMIMGIGSSIKGRLDKPATAPCSRSQETSVVPGKSLNNDVLSCFFTNPSTRVGDVTKDTFVGEPVISPAIFDSPRFVWIPIIDSPPPGNSAKVSVQGFVPGFISGEAAWASLNNPGTPTGAPNGLDVNNKKVRSMSVWFINPNALPAGTTNTGDEVEYRGTGAKVVVLVD